MPARLDPIVGRYLHVMLQERPHRLYFEEAGHGIPLVCLHTAGADGRQFRHMMTDAAITDAFRVIAFDLPWHGKSSPPADHAVANPARLASSTATISSQLPATTSQARLNWRSYQFLTST